MRSSSGPDSLDLGVTLTPRGDFRVPDPVGACPEMNSLATAATPRPDLVAGIVVTRLGVREVPPPSAEEFRALLHVADEMLDCRRSLLSNTDLNWDDRARLESKMRAHAETIWAYLNTRDEWPLLGSRRL